MVLIPDMRLQLDRGEAERFLAALDPTADEWTFQTFDDSRERKEENEAKWNARGHTGKKGPFAFTCTAPWHRVGPGLSNSTSAVQGYLSPST